MSDLVRSIEYVDAHGELQTIKRGDEEFLSAASGCFGLIGVVTHLTLELDPMTCAVMKPLKLPVIDAIPPPADYLPRIPKALRLDRTELQMKQAVAEFEERATTHYYAEWFWFPYSDRVWVNTWETTADAEGVEPYPSDGEIALQFVQAYLLEVLQDAEEMFKAAQFLPKVQTTLICKLLNFRPLVLLDLLTPQRYSKGSDEGPSG